MPIRHARYQELCRRCGDKTDSRCYRCKSPLCTVHMPTRKNRCADCERAFQRWPSREPRVLFYGLIAFLVWAGVTRIAFPISITAAISWALIFPLSIGTFAQRSLKSGRQLFLSQEIRPSLITDPRHDLHRDPRHDLRHDLHHDPRSLNNNQSITSE